MDKNQNTALVCAIADLVGAIECARDPGLFQQYDWEAAAESIEGLIKEFPDLDIHPELMKAFELAVGNSEEE